MNLFIIQETDMEEQFLTPAEVADILQLKKNTVYEMIKRGDLKAVKMGKQFRIARSALYEYMHMVPEQERGTIVVCGQDVLLDSLCALYNQKNTDGARAFRSQKGSYNGLYEMYQNENYVATCHLWDGETDTYNLPYVVRMLPGEQLSVFHLVRRWQGIYVKKGNPKNIHTFDDLLRPDVHIVNREKGSGIRVFIDEMLKLKKTDPSQIDGYYDVAVSHMLAAAAVSHGTADAAMGNQKTAAQVPGIDFIPVKQESYDIVFRTSDLKKKSFQDLVACIRSDEFKAEAQAVEGYDVTGMGEQLM